MVLFLNKFHASNVKQTTKKWKTHLEQARMEWISSTAEEQVNVNVDL